MSSGQTERRSVVLEAAHVGLVRLDAGRADAFLDFVIDNKLGEVRWLFGTIILDAYRTGEREVIAASLDELCSPLDNYGWSSAGIYVFWDYDTQQVLYVGLAIDLAERFRQHNGLVQADPSACKLQEINGYFEHRERLGYGVLVQSPMSQPATSKNRHRFSGKRGIEVVEETTETVKEEIRLAEGVLIEAFRRKHGVLPPWNKIHGSAKGQKRVTDDSYEIIRSFTLNTDSPLTSRSSLRELADNPTYERYENFLHGIRILMLYAGMDYRTAYSLVRRDDMLGTFGEMARNGYLNRAVQL